MRIRIFEPWRDMSREIHQKVVYRLFEGAVAGVSRDVRTEEKDSLYCFSSLVQASKGSKNLLG